MILMLKSEDFSNVCRNFQNKSIMKKNDYQEPRYINPMVDFGFKKIFKESGKKDLLIRPLNAIFGLDITDLEIGESEQLGDTLEDRRATFDLFCTASDGKKFIVEVQLARQEYFLERALYYSTFPIMRAARKGNWDFDFPPVFFLGLLNFDFRTQHGQAAADPERFIHYFDLRDDETGALMTDRLCFAFLEIGRFDKPMEECVRFEEKFLYMMKNMPKFAETPEMWDDPYFESMLAEAEFARMTEQEKEQYRIAMRRDWDYWNTIDCARQEGKAEGLAEGEAKGKAEGKAEGLAEGQRTIARRLLAAGLSVELVAEGTELSVDEVIALQNS